MPSEYVQYEFANELSLGSPSAAFGNRIRVPKGAKRATLIEITGSGVPYVGPSGASKAALIALVANPGDKTVSAIANMLEYNPVVWSHVMSHQIVGTPNNLNTTLSGQQFRHKFSPNSPGVRQEVQPGAATLNWRFIGFASAAFTAWFMAQVVVKIDWAKTGNLGGYETTKTGYGDEADSDGEWF